MGLGSKIFLLLGLVITIVVLLTSTKVAAARNLAEASTPTRKAETTAEALKMPKKARSVSRTFPAPCHFHHDGGCP
ncbi:hypothetical protein AB3S75_019432 [Citrus x aurantiifolia]